MPSAQPCPTAHLLSSVMSIFSYTRSSVLCIITTHSPLLVSHTSARLLMPVHHLYTSSGGGSVSAGLTHAGNRCLARDKEQVAVSHWVLNKPCLNTACNGRAPRTTTASMATQHVVLHTGS
jgi:hypothetical protein